MNDEKRKVNECGFADDLLSYLYEEMSMAEATKFENHLPQCENCSFELSDFSVARSGIRDWKSDSFDRLQTPAVLIEYRPSENVIESNRKAKGSWFAGLFEMFSFQSAIGVSAAAVLMIAAVAGFIMLRSDPSVNIDNTEVAAVETDSTPLPESNKSTAATTASRTTTESSEVKKNDGPVDSQGSTVKPTKVSGTNSQRPKVVKSEPVRSQRQQKPKAMPRLVEDDEEEDTLRLSDLLEEIGAR